MSSITLFDLNDLLRPVTSEDPGGPNMLLSMEFDEIQSARQQEDPSLDQGEWITARKAADLPFVTQRCIQLLQEQTKDLRLAIWLTDALASQHGLPGLTQGYALLGALAARYWDSLHPQPEDGDMGARVGNISWFLKRSVEQLGNAPLLQSGSIRINMQAWQAAVALDQAVRRHPSEAHEIVKGKTTLEELEKQRSSVPDSSLKVLAAQLAQFRAASTSLEDTLNDRLGDEAPALQPYGLHWKIFSIWLGVGAPMMNSFSCPPLMRPLPIPHLSRMPLGCLRQRDRNTGPTPTRICAHSRRCHCTSRAGRRLL